MAEVSFKVSADTAEAIRRIAIFSKETADKLGAVSKSVNGLVSEKLAERATQVFGTVKNGVIDVIKASSQAEDTFQGMVQALRAAGDYSDSAVRGFQELAEQLQATTRFDDDVILSQVKLAKSFNVTNEEAKKLIVAAVEMSAGIGGSLDENVKKLGQTLDGTTGKLAEQVPELRRFTAEQLRAGAAVEFVEKRFRGSAASSTKTFAGATEQAANAVENLKESLGDMITKSDLVIGTIELFTKLVQSIEKSESMKKLIAGAAGAVLAITGAVVALGGLAAAIAAASAVAATFGVVLAASLGPVTLIAAGIAGIGAALGVMAVSTGKATEGQGGLQGELEASRKKVDQLEKALEQFHKTTTLIASSPDRISYEKRVGDKLQAEYEKLYELEKRFKRFQDTQSNISNTPKFRIPTELEGQLKSLEEKFKNFGTSRAQILENEYKSRQRILDDSLRTGFLSEARYAELSFKVKRKYDEELEELREKDLERQNKLFEDFIKETSDKLKAATANPFSGLFGDRNPLDRIPRLVQGQGPGSEFQDAAEAQANAQGNFMVTGRALGGLQSVLGGAQGATNLLANLATEASRSFLGPAADAVGPIVQALAQGPEAVREMVTQFADAIPVIIENIAASIPELIDALADKLPDIIERLAEKAPTIIAKLAEAAPKVMAVMALGSPKVIAEMVKDAPKIVGKILQGLGELIQQAIQGGLRFAQTVLEGAGQFVARILQGAVNFVGQIIEGAGRFIGELVSKIPGFGGGGGGGLLGGRIIPGILKTGAPAERAATASSGVGGLTPLPGSGVGTSTYNEELGRLTRYGMSRDRDRWIMQRRAYLERNGIDPLDAARRGAFKGGAVTQSAAGGGEVLQPIILQVGEQQLARVMYSLNKRGFRTS